MKSTNLKLYRLKKLRQSKIKQWCYHYLGYGYIHYHMLVMNKMRNSRRRRPSNITLWLLTIYSGIFSIAFQRYENQVNRVYSSFSAYVELLDSNKDVLFNIVELQNRKVPFEPNYFLFWTTFMSFFSSHDSPFRPVSNDIANIAPSYLSLHPISLESFKTNNEITYTLPRSFRPSLTNSSFGRFLLKRDHSLTGPYNFIRVSDCKFGSLEVVNSRNKEIGIGIDENSFIEVDSVLRTSSASILVINNLKNNPTIQAKYLRCFKSNFKNINLKITGNHAYSHLSKFTNCNIKIDTSWVKKLKNHNSLINTYVNGEYVERSDAPNPNYQTDSLDNRHWH